ncbi:unnamed protein product [Lactuca saligna]|uniref:F-box domain-containing protein n=1 Tax=Lactuca saligna TaxID=75948 RepID=A0AA36A2I6_LACSI|nr:unnamed protein product [Lactuca saligna]
MVITRSKVKKLQINDDLLIEIFLRLPLASVRRFKSVSKHWRSLLTNRCFTLIYKNGCISCGLFVKDFYVPFDDENRNPPFLNLDFYPDPRGIKILQSCNGLLLCCSKKIKRDCRYYVFNPTTKQFALIPSVPGGGHVRRTICFMGLAFHQTDCPRYKLVCIRYIRRDEKLFQIQIYSSDTEKWKISDQSFSANSYTSFSSGVYWHQAIHWAHSNGNPSYFKLDTEELQTMPSYFTIDTQDFTGRYHEGEKAVYFGESRGCLHLVKRVQRSFQLKVYEMLNHHSGWFVKYVVKLDVHRMNAIRWFPDHYAIQVLDLVRGGEEDETFFMVIQILGKIVRYNFREKSFKQMFDQTIPIWHGGAFRYIETIVTF